MDGALQGSGRSHLLLDARRSTGLQAAASVTRPTKASEIPRAYKFKTRRFEVRQVPGRQAAAVEARNGRDHSVGRGHGSALSECCTHDVVVEGGSFREGEDPVGKNGGARRPSPTPSARPAGRGEFSRYRRRSRQLSPSAMPALRRFARARRSQRGLASCAASPRRHWCRGGSKLRSGIALPVFANDGLQIEIAAIFVRKARIEGGCRLAPGPPNFISFERALHDIGGGPMFTAR
jgi:hypothetical protein